MAPANQRWLAGANSGDVRCPTDMSRNVRDALVALLSTRSEEFRREWARHDVWFHRSGTKRLRHPLVGELTLLYEVLDLPADPGQTVAVYSAEAGSASEELLLEQGFLVLVHDAGLPWEWSPSSRQARASLRAGRAAG